MGSNVPIPRVSRDVLLSIAARQNELLEFCLLMRVDGITEQNKQFISRVKKLLEREGFVSPNHID